MGRYKDWGEASEEFDYVAETVRGRSLVGANEAQTRYSVIDRVVRDVLGWRHGTVMVEERVDGTSTWVDYLLRLRDWSIVVEAKKIGASFPTPTRKPRLKLGGAVLGQGEIAAAIQQVREYAVAKGADVAVATNGRCWCLFDPRTATDETFATLYFPFDMDGHGEGLFSALATVCVEEGGLVRVTERPREPEDRLGSVIDVADARVDRNNIADHISPALDRAFYASALLTDEEALRRCFITTDRRTRFDKSLGVHLADPKPQVVTPAPRIRRDKGAVGLDFVEAAQPSHAPPVTLLIGPVGAGKSTYLSHFSKIAARAELAAKNAHWIEIDFENLGRGGDPRGFLYRAIRDYLAGDHPENPTDWKSLVEPAYEETIAALARGPLAPIFTQKQLFREKVSEYIAKEYEEVEPYVDRLLKHLASRQLTVLVLDNVDLYEDSELETRVFSEGLALSRRAMCHVIVCIRDSTFVKHRSESVFDAYELRKLWLDPPPFPAVLSSRLSYSKQILGDKSAQIEMKNGAKLNVPDLGAFFDIVQRSVLSGDAGQFVENAAGGDIRRGLTLIQSFLTSGHIQADRALREYINGNDEYHFPFHEVFKGSMLGQWSQYKEERANCPNLFDSRLGSRRLRLLRGSLLNHLFLLAKHEQTKEVLVADCAVRASYVGASEETVGMLLESMRARGLLRNVTPERPILDSTVAISRSGAYYVASLTKTFVYAEACMYDTAIEDPGAWDKVLELTHQIGSERSVVARIDLRCERIEVFLAYLQMLEQEMTSVSGADGLGPWIAEVAPDLRHDLARVRISARRNYKS